MRGVDARPRTRSPLRILAKAHRWLGWSLGGPMAVWFLSGAVMVFSGYPSFTDAERLAHLPPLPCTDGEHGAAHLEAACAGAAETAVLHSRRGQLVCLVTNAGGRRVARWLRTGQRLEPLGRAQALERARESLEGGSHDTRWIERIAGPDQWTLSGSFAPYFPLHHVALGDEQGTEAYISARTGELVHITRAGERFWAWLGAIPHWIYPTFLRRHADTWRWLVILLAAFGLPLCISGLVWGTVLTGRSARREGRASPLRSPSLRTHHLVGLGFGVLAFTWVSSGALSLSPFGWPSSPSPEASERRALAGGPLALGRFELSPEAAIEACAKRRKRTPRALRLRQLGGRPLYECHFDGAESLVVRADRSVAKAMSRVSDKALVSAFREGFPTRNIRHAVHRDHGDLYYYAEDGDRTRDHLRLSLAPPHDADVYLDPHTATIRVWYDGDARMWRWLYRGLHTLELPGLQARPTLTDCLAIVAMAIGTILSLSPVLRTLRRLRSHYRRRHRTRAAPVDELYSDSRAFSRLCKRRTRRSLSGSSSTARS